MDNVLMMPPSITNDADVSDDESESISLDLHVSDTDDSIPESTKKDTLESEDEILNKFINEEEDLVNGHSKNVNENGDLEKNNTLLKKDNDQEMKEDFEETPKKCEEKTEEITHVEPSKANGVEPEKQNSLNEPEKQNSLNEPEKQNILNEPIDEEMKIVSDEKNKDDDNRKITPEKEEVTEENGVENEEIKLTEKETPLTDEADTASESKENTAETSDEKKETEVTNDQNIEVGEKEVSDDGKPEMNIKENEEETVLNEESDKKASKGDEENQEDGDLLQVMETSFVDETDKDENSCSSSSKEEESEESPKDDNAETTTKDEESEAMEEDKEIEHQTKQDDSQDTENNGQGSEINSQDSENNDQESPESNGQDDEIDIQDKVIVDQNKEDDQNNGIDDEVQSDNLEGCENDESHDVDTHECPMDIEENNIGGVIITEHDKSLENQEENQVGEKANEDTSEIMTPAVEETSTTVVNGDVGEDVVNLIDDEIVDEEKKKSAKRPRTEDNTTDDDSKKMKLELPPPVPKTIRALNSFKNYMKDKALKNMTRDQLEEFCLQKICECLVDKSELADLRQKVRVLEQVVDMFRKDANTISNQTRDLKIVHEKVTTALKVAKEQRGKHLVPVKITRSVGLQAVLEHPNRRHTLQNGVVQNVRTISNNNNNNITNVNNSAKINSSVVNNNIVNSNTSKSPLKPQQSPAQMPNKSPMQQRTPSIQVNKQPIQKENRTIPTPRSTPIQQQNSIPRKSTEAPKTVIDLTDEDEKTATSSPTNRTNRVNNNNHRLNGQNAKTPPTIVTTSNSSPKLMMIPSNVLSSPRPIMLKVNSGIVSQANGITIPPTSQVSIVAQSVMSKSNSQQVRVGITNVTSSRSPPVQKFRHPAPLPPPPSVQNQITTQRPIPPRPHLNLTKSPCGTGIVLQWKMPYQLDLYEAIVSYQLYAYQETKNPPRTDSWGKIGDVKALELPMAVTLTQFAVGNRYYFAVRAVDVHKRLGPFSDPQTILL